MNADDARYAAQVLNSRNAKLTRRAEAAVEVVLWIAIAAGGAAMFVAWATPCAAGTLCMAAVITRTRTGWLQRMANRLRAALLRVQLRDLEITLANIEEDLEMLPAVRTNLRIDLDAARIRLTDIELSGRSS